MAGSRANAVDENLVAGVQGTAQTAAGAKPPPAPFDAAKFAGIFAAIGLALGAIGTAIAALVTGLLTLAWWQIPLAFAGVILIISGPSMLIASLKLRRRNIAPLLDANGWAVGANGTVLHSSDGGASWQVQPVGLTDEKGDSRPLGTNLRSESSTPSTFRRPGSSALKCI